MIIRIRMGENGCRLREKDSEKDILKMPLIIIETCGAVLVS